MKTIIEGVTAKFPHRSSWDVQLFVSGRSVGLFATSWLHRSTLRRGAIASSVAAFKTADEARDWMSAGEQLVVFIKSNDGSCEKVDDYVGVFLAQPTDFAEDDRHVNFDVLERVTSADWFRQDAA